jgi:hypothetical protein
VSKPPTSKPTTVEEAMILQHLLCGAVSNNELAWWPVCYGVTNGKSNTLTIRKV